MRLANGQNMWTGQHAAASNMNPEIYPPLSDDPLQSENPLCLMNRTQISIHITVLRLEYPRRWNGLHVCSLILQELYAHEE